MNTCINLLVVEDKPADFRLIVRHLEKHGMDAHCRCVTNREELEAAVEQGGWDAVLSDYSVPKLDFQHTLALLQARHHDLPLILVSGSIGEERAVELLTLGVWDFLLKDNLTRLVPAIERSLRDVADRRERRRADAALRESEERYAWLAEQSGTFIWEVDAQGLYTYVSPVVEKVLGYRPDELIGRMHYYDLHPESGREAFKANAFEVFQRKEPFTNFINAAQTKDGRDVWLVTTGQPLLDADERFLGYQGSDTDITERMRHEAELLKMDKLQSVGTLAGGIAHDFNNILQGLYGNLSLAIEDLSKTHPSYALLEEAEKSMNRATRLTKQLLTFARGGDPVKEAVSLGAMAEEIARFDLTGSSVSLVYQHDEGLWQVDADRGQIQQVVSNLVINARQAMPKGGHLTITLENVDLPAAAVPTLKQGRYVKVIVRDEGCGIEPKVIEHIFDPYFTTKQTGNGLGLTTAWSIINKHNGHIGVVSEMGKGTTFTFYLPASASLLSAEEKPQSAESPSPALPAKILVMDDEVMVCDLAAKMLTRYGYSVATAPGGQETIALYRKALEAGAPFDLVIMDLTIPGGTGGKEVLQTLLALDPKVRAIVSSGYAEDPIMGNPAAYGFKGTVAKPYTARALREAVARVLT
jgi:PAS domain S-box-containing protein